MNAIREYLRQYTGANIMYFPNPGNAGDALIAAATYQSLEGSGLSYETPDPRGFSGEDQLVFYGGGGNLVGMTTYSARFIAQIHRRVNKLVILPHTIKNVTPLLRELGRNVEIICREPISYEYVASTVRKATVLLMDDMAFSLNAEEIVNGRCLESVTSITRRALSNKLIRTRSPSSVRYLIRMWSLPIIKRSIGKYESSFSLNCFRTDGERSEIVIPEDNLDVSLIFSMGVSKDLSFRSAYEFLVFLGKFHEVRTNRLHVAIAAALLGKSVKFYENSYYKCRAVYEYSLRRRFPNVEWMS